MQGAPSRLAEIFAVFGLLALIAIGHFGGNGHGTEFVTLGAFLAAAYKIIPGISRLLNLTGQMKTYEFTVNGLLDRKPQHAGPEKQGPEMFPEAIESLECSRVGFQYGQQAVLRDISLELHKGDFLGIQGHSGKGKTTLFNILLGFVSESAGTVRINGLEVVQNARRRYWDRIAYVKQQPFMLHDSVLVNITLQERGYDEERLRNAVAVAGLDELLAKLPGGLHGIIAEHGKNISGGQRQRIAIGRAIYKQADLILLDEPCSELDEASEERLLLQLRSLAGAGKMILMITHNVQSLSFCTHR